LATGGLAIRLEQSCLLHDEVYRSVPKLARPPCLVNFAKFAKFAKFANLNPICEAIGSRTRQEPEALQPPYHRCSSTNDRTTIITPEAVTAIAATAGANRSIPDHRPVIARRSRKRPA
jgi:hypothetical protein